MTTTTIDCDHNRRRLTIARRGVLTLDDLANSVIRMQSTDMLSYSVLVDARQVATSLQPADIHGIIGKIHAAGAASDHGPIAIVASDDLTFGMSRMFASMSDSVGIRVGVFREMAEAESWLNEITA